MTTPALIRQSDGACGNNVDIGDDDPVTLDEACRLFFRGALTKSGLRTEAKKGNLDLLRIAGKDFVTRSAINRMMEKCRVKEPPPASGSERTPEHGSSKMEPPVSPQDILEAKLRSLNESLRPTTRKPTRSRAEVVPMKSRS